MAMSVQMIGGVMHVMTTDFLMDGDIYEDKEYYPEEFMEAEDYMIEKKKIRIPKIHEAKEKRYIP